MYSLSKIQDNAFRASVDNAKEANKAIKSSQNRLLVIATAEVSFLGILFFQDFSSDQGRLVVSIKILLVITLLSFIAFIIGSILQYHHAKGASREHYSISVRAVEYLIQGNEEVDKIPSDLKYSGKQIATNKYANYCLFSAYLGILLVTIGIILVIILL